MTEKNQNPKILNGFQDLSIQEKIYTSEDLFRSSSSVLIDHRGSIYTL